jgi:hypothetical protein
MSDATRAAELPENCPFCGATGDNIFRYSQDDWMHCESCHAEGPVDYHGQWLVAWNRRALPPAVAELVAICREMAIDAWGNREGDISVDAAVWTRFEVALAKFPPDATPDMAGPGHQAAAEERQPESV